MPGRRAEAFRCTTDDGRRRTRKNTSLAANNFAAAGPASTRPGRWAKPPNSGRRFKLDPFEIQMPRRQVGHFRRK